MTQPLDGIIVETTGLANPSPVIQTFTKDDRFTKMDAVVTIVDAAHCGRHFGQKSEGEEVEFEAQIQYADRILLNKARPVVVGCKPSSARGVEAARWDPLSQPVRTGHRDHQLGCSD